MATPLSRDQIASAVSAAVQKQPIVDMHTHLYSPVFGTPVPNASGKTDPAGLLLWGLDELITYHYLIAEVYRVVKATLKSHMFFHRNPKEAVRFIMEVAGLSNLDEAKEVWSERVKQASELAQAGRASDDALMTNIERVREQMKMVGAAARFREKIALDQVYDFSFVKKAYDEIQASKWDPLRHEYAKR